MLAISANGNRAGSGIVWAVTPLDGDANMQRGVKGIVLALDAQDVSRTLWTSEQFSQRDRLGLFAKFTNPMIADGKVYVATYGDDEERLVYPKEPTPVHPTKFPKNYYVAVYGPMPETRGTVINQDRDDVTVVRASTSHVTIEKTNCAAVDASTIDCTDALTQAAGAPSFHRVLVGANASLAGCSVVRVTTASKKLRSRKVGRHRILRSASVAEGSITARRFRSFCAVGEAQSCGYRHTARRCSGDTPRFCRINELQRWRRTDPARPCLQAIECSSSFLAENKLLRNWDLASNYLINSDITQFDRSGDVLQ